MNHTMGIEISSDNEISNLATAEKQHQDQKSGFYAAFIFFVWPLLAVVTAFWNYRSGWAKNILWAFIAFYGFSFAIGTESQDSDIVRYVEEVQYLHGIQMTAGDAIEYYQQSGEVDLLRTFLAVTVSRFTGSQAVLTLVYGIIFGFFFSRNIWYVLLHLEGKMRPITLFLMVCLFLVIPIWNITTFRMWTAAHVFIYGLLPFLYERKWSGLFIAAGSILIHFAFLIPVAALFAYVLFGNRLLIYFVFFMSTFFVSEINIKVFNNVVESYAPEVIQERTSGYRQQGHVESYREGAQGGNVWYVRWYGRALKWVLFGFIVSLFIKGRTFFAKNEQWLRLFSFVLLFYGFANLFSSLPSGGRFIAIANFVALALVILYVQNRRQDQVMRQFAVTTVPFLLLFIIVSIRIGIYSISATAILGNPVIAFFFSGEHISLNEFMRMVI